jgi:hypothetical protein
MVGVMWILASLPDCESLPSSSVLSLLSAVFIIWLLRKKNQLNEADRGREQRRLHEVVEIAGQTFVHAGALLLDLVENGKGGHVFGSLLARALAESAKCVAQRHLVHVDRHIDLAFEPELFVVGCHRALGADL